MDDYKNIFSVNVFLSEEDKVGKQYIFIGNDIKKKEQIEKDLIYSKKPYVFVDESIFIDDTILDINSKIQKVLNINSSFYLWSEEEITSFEQKELFVNEFLNNVFHDKRYTKVNDLLNQLEFTSSFKIKKKDLNYEDWIDIYQSVNLLMNEIILYTVYHNLKFASIKDKYTLYYFPLNPLKELKFVLSNNVLYTKLTYYKTLEYFNPNLSILNVLLGVNEKEGNKKKAYFPDGHNIISNEQKNFSIRKSLDVQHSIKQYDSSIKDVKVNNTVNKILFKNNRRFNGINQIPLDYIFNKYLPTKEVPLLEYNSAMGSVYKLNKNSLYPAGYLTKNTLLLWTQESTGKIKLETLKLRIVDEIFPHVPFMATVTIYTNNTYKLNIQLSIKNRLFFNFVTLSEYVFPKVNNVLKTINYILNDDVIDLLKKDILLHKYDSAKKLSYGLLTMRSHSYIYNTPMIPFEKLTTHLINNSWPFFSLKKTDNNSIQLIYKRVDDFISRDIINQYIKKHLTSFMSKDEKLLHLSYVFGVSKSFVEPLVDSSISNKFDKKNKLVNFSNVLFEETLITIDKLQNNGYKVICNDINNHKHLQRILFLLCGSLFTFSEHNSKNSAQTNSNSFFIKKKQHHENIDANSKEEYIKSNSNSDHSIESLSLNSDVDLSNKEEDNDNEGEFELESFKDENMNANNNSEDTSLDDDVSKHIFSIPINTIVNEDVNDISKTKLDQIPIPLKNEGKSKSKNHSGILHRLQSADQEMFPKGTYGTKCQSTQTSIRQPIVVSPQRLAYIMKKYPQAVPNWVKFGSSKEHAKNNIYFCPDVWCPVSEIAMSRLEFLDQNQKCPGKNEEPILLYKSVYTTSTSKNRNTGEPYVNSKSRAYVDVKSMNLKSNKQFDYAPCCMKKKPKEKEEIEEDKPVRVINLSKIHKNDLMKKNSKLVSYDYPLQEQTVVPQNRIGFLPLLFYKLLDKSKKNLTYFRHGVNHGNQSLLSSIAFLLGFDNNSMFLKYIIENLNVMSFLIAQNGELCKRFLITNESEFKSNFLEFKSWFLNPKQKEYIARFGLFNNVREVLMNYPEFTKNMEYFDQVKREFSIYKSYSNFLNFLQNDNMAKQPDDIIDLIPEINMIILSRINHEELQFACPTYNTFENVYNAKSTIMLIKNDFIYEPIVKKTDKKTKLEKIFQSDDVDIAFLIDNLKSSCNSDIISNKEDDSYVTDIMISIQKIKGLNIQDQVIGYNMKLIGFTVYDTESETQMYIPLRLPTYIRKKYIYDNVHNIKFIDTMYQVIKPTPHKEKYFHVFEQLNNVLSKKYFEYIDDNTDKNAIYMHFGSSKQKMFIKQTIPLIPNLTSINEQYKSFFDNNKIFTRSKSEDERSSLIDTTNMVENFIKAFKNELIHYINKYSPDVISLIFFLRNENNPLPSLLKKQILLQNLDTIIDKITILTNNTNSKNTMFSNIICNETALNHCQSQCKRVKVNSNESCRLGIPEEFKNKILSKVIDDLLNPFMELKKESFDNTNNILNRNIIIFTKNDLEDETIEKILDADKDTAYLGYSFKDVPLKISKKQHSHSRKNVLPSTITTYQDEFQLKEWHGMYLSIPKHQDDKYSFYKTLSYIYNLLESNNANYVDYIKISNYVKNSNSNNIRTKGNFEKELRNFGNLLNITIIMFTRSSKSTQGKQSQLIYKNINSDNLLLFRKDKDSIYLLVRNDNFDKSSVIINLRDLNQLNVKSNMKINIQNAYNEDN